MTLKRFTTRGRLASELTQMGFSVVPSQANFVWCTHPDQPLRPLYEALKKDRILIRYMNYASWGDGLRISVGTDEQIDAALARMKKRMTARIANIRHPIFSFR